MAIYIILIVVILFVKEKIVPKKYKLIDVFLVLLLILVAGLRYYIGTDYFLYEKMFNIPDYYHYERVEIGFKYLIYFVKLISENGSELFFLFLSAITIVPIYYIIKKHSKYPGISIFFFLSLGYFALSLNIIRQMLAVAITFFAFKYIKKKSLIKYIITIIIAFTIHNTALLMIPFYWISRLKLNKKKMYILIIVMIIGIILFNPIFKFVTENFSKYGIYETYGDRVDVVAGLGTYFIAIINLILMCILIRNKDKLVAEDENAGMYLNIAIFSVFFYMLSIKNILFARMGYYFSIYLIMLLPLLISKIKSKDSMIVKVAIYAFFIGYYFMHIYYFGEIYPYVSIFNK